MLAIFLTIRNEEERQTAECIWDQHRRYIQALASKILKNRCDVEDAVMDTVRCIVQNIHKFVGLNELDVICLITVYTKHAAFKIYNKNKAESEHLTAPEDFDCADESGNVEDTVMTRCEYEEVSRYLNSMPTRYSYPFLLHHYYGWSIREIMRFTDLSEANVKKRLFRAKKQLKEYMEAHHE